MADDLGFNSLHQLKIFILHFENEGYSIGDITGYESADPLYSRHSGAVRKLMKGSPDRGFDGLDILRNGGRAEGMRPNENSIYLTPKGRRWAKKLRLF